MFIENTIQREDLYDQRVTEVAMYNQLIDPLQSRSSPQNYSNVSVSVNLAGASAQQYDETRRLTLFNPWISEATRQEWSAVITARFLSQYSDIPIQLTFLADIKDVQNLELADYFVGASRLIIEPDGTPRRIPMQVIAIEEIESGNRIKITAQSYALLNMLVS